VATACRTCIHCPDPTYTDPARQAKVNGTSIFEVLIATSGEAAQLQPVKMLGYGLDEKAFEAIKHWKFRRATKDGSPVPVVVPIEVTFRIYKRRFTAFPYPLFFSSASTSLATSFSVSNTPCPVTATPSSTGSPFFCSCFVNSATGIAFGKSRLFSCST